MSHGCISENLYLLRPPDRRHPGGISPLGNAAILAAIRRERAAPISRDAPMSHYA
jgi:hypothetical protein